MDEVLGPRNDDAKSSSSEGSSPRSSLTPEDSTHYSVEGGCVVSSASVQANSDHSSPADSPLPVTKNMQQTDKQEEEEEVKENGHDEAVVEKEEEKKKEEEKEVEEEEEVHSKEVTVPASESPELVIKVEPAESGTSDKPPSSSDDDSEGEEAPPTPSDTTSTSTEGDRQPDSASSEPTSPATNGHENGLRSSPDLDARRPTG